MAEGAPLPYFTRLRIIARQAGYFFYRLAKLDTRYDDCPVICKTEYADPANGCPDCEFTAYFNTFKKNYAGNLRKDTERRIRQGVTGNTPNGAEIARLVDQEVERRPSFEEMLADFGRLLSIEQLAGTESAEERGGHNPEWTVIVAEAISLIRNERRKVAREMRKAEDAKTPK